MSIRDKAQEMADRLREHPRGEEDLNTAALLVRLADVYMVSRELVHAKTHEHSKAAYVELIDLIKGKHVD